MKIIAIMAVLGLGCGGTEPPPPAAPMANHGPATEPPPPDAALSAADSAIGAMTRFTDEMCDCADQACSDAVQARLSEWATQQAREAQAKGESEKPSEQDMKALTEVAMRYGECMQKAMAGTP
jgi:hypothetical protein